LPEAHGLLDVAEDRLHRGLPRLVASLASFGLELSSHAVFRGSGLGDASAGGHPRAPLGVLDLFRGNEGFDAPFFQDLEVGRAKVAGVESSLGWLPVLARTCSTMVSRCGLSAAWLVRSAATMMWVSASTAAWAL